jgi:hypothetical protein
VSRQVQWTFRRVGPGFPQGGSKLLKKRSFFDGAS